MDGEHFTHLSDQRVAIALPFGERLYLKGKVKLVEVLYHELEVQGFKFDSSFEKFPQEIYSPRGYSLLYLESYMTKHPQPNQNDKPLKDKIIKKFVKSYKENCCIFVLQKLDTSWTHYLEDALVFSDAKKQKMSIFGKDDKWKKDTVIVPENVEDELDVNFVIKGEFQEMKMRLLNAKGNFEYINPRHEWEHAHNYEWELAVRNVISHQGKKKRWRKYVKIM